MTTELTRFTDWASTQPQQRYTSLLGMLADEKGLLGSFRRQDGRKAAGIDGIRKEAYGENLSSEKRVARHSRGKAFLVRYCDDFLACFEQEQDARDFERQLIDRLNAFDLEVEPSKTALQRFGDLVPAFKRRTGQRKADTFNFLGFTHYLKITRGGRVRVRRKTQRKRYSGKLNDLKVRLMAMRTCSQQEILWYVRRHLQGHIQYYGVSGNFRSLHRYRRQVSRLLFKSLNRQSQRKSFNWQRYSAWVESWLPKVKIVHRWTICTE